VTLLAAVAALSSLRLPAVRVNEDGNVVPADGADDQADNQAGGKMESDAAAVEAPEQPINRCCAAESVLSRYRNRAQQPFDGLSVARALTTLTLTTP
jgi:hypothetical protein